jgi:hypothetical protein
VGTVVRPGRTFDSLGQDPQAFRKGLTALALVLVTYTVILAAFIARDYPAMAPSVLPLSVDEQYSYQIAYQGPLFIVMTIVLAAILWLVTRRRSDSLSLSGLFAQVSFATAVPFALTTMLVELVIAVLVLARLVTPAQTLDWLTGAGSWFATVYQMGGILWLIVLLCLATRSATKAPWYVSVPFGLALSVIYGLPIGLFIR